MNKGKIVVVDDEKIVTSAFSTLLKVEGFSDAHFFNNPKDAIEFLKENINTEKKELFLPFVVQAMMKSHLTKVEFISLGLGFYY